MANKMKDSLIILQSLTGEQITAMTWEELKQAQQLAPFLTLVNQEIIARIEAKELHLAKQEEEVLRFEQKFVHYLQNNEFLCLNVGGTRFTVSKETLCKERGTFFQVLCSGRWELQLDPIDQSFFINRSPALFPLLLDHLRGQPIQFDSLSRIQQNQLALEADFYQIESLVKLICKYRIDVFNPSLTMGEVSLQDDGMVGTRLGEGTDRTCRIISTTPFEFRVEQQYCEKKLVLNEGTYLLMGIAPKVILTDVTRTYNCGWFLNADGSVLSPQGKNKPYIKRGLIPKGSLVSIRLHCNGDLSFAIDEQDLGIAFTDVSCSDPLFLVVLFWSKGDKVTLVNPDLSIWDRT
jgi:hypothetical protein